MLCNKTNRETRVHYRKQFDMTLCENHYSYIKHHGRLPDENINTDNQYILYEDYAEIIIFNKYGEELTRSQIDIDDIEICKQYKWYLSRDRLKSPYPTIIQLHRLVMGVLNKDKNIKIDHIDRNPLNNRKNNLRTCTQLKNSQNKNKQTNNISGFIGVCYTNRNNRWRAFITVNKKQIHIGYFKNKEDAIIARLKAEKEYFGEYAPQISLFKEYNIA